MSTSDYSPLHLPLQDMVIEQPLLSDFFNAFQIDVHQNHCSLMDVIDNWTPEQWAERGLSRDAFVGHFIDFCNAITSAKIQSVIESLEVMPGKDKSGAVEPCSLILRPGEVTCIVGPTGSGKSRLLADIEWLANRDTPTGRQILINGALPADNLKNEFGGKLVSQITQNMNFVLDMDVQSFLLLHAQSRFLDDADSKVAEVIDLANQLSGESFETNTPVTFLSGGQSRALMIADVACIGRAPIVLIDEIENAGVDKKKALELLVSQDKIVLMATHDPLLILQANKRVVIKNGGMHKILEVNADEKALCSQLQEMDLFIQKTRNFFRMGHSLNHSGSFE